MKKIIIVFILTLFISLIYLIEISLVYLVIKCITNLNDETIILIAVFTGTISTMTSILLLKIAEIKSIIKT